MPCLICGKSGVRYGMLKHVNNIKAKKPNIDSEIDHILFSNTHQALKLMNKLKKHDNEIRRLEMKSAQADRNQLLCDDCLKKIIKKIKNSVNGNITGKDNESEYSKINEMLRVYEVCSLIKKEILYDLYNNIDHPIDKSAPEDYDEFKDFRNNLETSFFDTANNINEFINNYDYREFYIAKLYYILGYYNNALLRFQNLLNELEQKDDEAYMKEYREKEKHEVYINRRNEWKNEILEIIYEIKEKNKE
jgi:hypothetical protein